MNGWRHLGIVLLPLLVSALLLLCASRAFAHPMPESQIWIDTTPDGMQLTARLPLNRLEFAVGRPLADHPDSVLDRDGEALAAYLLVHVGARSSGQGWQALRPRLRIVGSRTGGADAPGAAAAGASPELEAVFALHAPPGADPRTPTLLYDAITHEVRTHRVQVFLRNDWTGGVAGQVPQLLGELSYGHNTLAVPLRRSSPGAGFLSLFKDGLRHIAEGSDHLLFLLLLLLVAPLGAARRRWLGVRTPRLTMRHTTAVVTAFTLGHTVTLVLGSTGCATLPAVAVEVAVALTIAAAARHAWRPLFARIEVPMALGFGLVHGMAFAATLAGAGLTPWQHAQALLAFNLGIEAMQLIVVAAVLPPLMLLGSLLPAAYARMRQALAVLAGGMAAAWIVQRLGCTALDGVVVLGDGGAVPRVLVALLWLAALGCLAVRRLDRATRGGALQ